MGAVGITVGPAVAVGVAGAGVFDSGDAVLAASPWAQAIKTEAPAIKKRLLSQALFIGITLSASGLAQPQQYGPQLFDQRGQELLPGADDAEVGRAEHHSTPVLVDGDDHSGPL